jgi:hypothetical protein
MPQTRSKVTKMNIPLVVSNSNTTDHLLELALAMLDDARYEQNNVQLPANNWLTNNFTLEIILAKVAANKTNGTINVSASATLRPSELSPASTPQLRIALRFKRHRYPSISTSWTHEARFYFSASAPLPAEAEFPPSSNTSFSLVGDRSPRTSLILWQCSIL